MTKSITYRSEEKRIKSILSITNTKFTCIDNKIIFTAPNLEGNEIIHTIYLNRYVTQMGLKIFMNGLKDLCGFDLAESEINFEIFYNENYHTKGL